MCEYVPLIGHGRVDGVLLFSPRTARTFVHVVCAAALKQQTERLSAYCLSANVVAALKASADRALMGGEGNGGVIIPGVCWVRDSLSAMALVLSL